MPRRTPLRRLLIPALLACAGAARAEPNGAPSIDAAYLLELRDIQSQQKRVQQTYLPADGTAITSIPEVGPHYRVLTVEKNINPQNQLAVYTRLDEQCRVMRDPENSYAPVLDYYWLMDRYRYKPVNVLIKKGIRDRIQVGDSSPDNGGESFSVGLLELNEVRNDLGPVPLFWVRAEKRPAGCAVAAFITLGPSDSNAVLRLDSIYSEAERNWRLGATVHFIELRGVNVQTGLTVVRTYRAP